jgi:hypothetical protein
MPLTEVTLDLPRLVLPWTRRKGEAARALLEETLNRPDFQEAVRQAVFSDNRFVKPDGTELTDLTNDQILDIILKGVESDTKPDYVLQLHVRFHPFGSAVGETDENEVIHDLWYVFERSSEAEVAGHWLHEWSHIAGFRHDWEDTPRRATSVPYLLGDLLIKYANMPPPNRAGHVVPASTK